MYRSSRRRKSPILEIALIIVLCLFIAVVVIMERKDRSEREALEIQQQKARAEQREQMELLEKQREEEAFQERSLMYQETGLLDETNGKVIVTYSDFCNGIMKLNGEIARNEEVGFSVSQNGGLLLYKITANTTTGSSASFYFHLTTGNDEIKQTFYLTGQEQNFYIPVNQTSESMLKIIPSENIIISDFSITAYDDSVAYSRLKNGYYLNEPYSQIYLENSISDIAERALLADREFVYFVTDNELRICRILEDNTLKFYSRVQGLGSNTWKMTFLKDGNAIGIASRHDGVYFIDITDKKHPIIASHYQTSELATDISEAGEYAVVSSRYFGVELVDIHDLYHPQYVSTVWKDSEEFESCLVKDNYMYVSTWANKKLEVYNISDVYHPILVDSIQLNGRGYYMDFYNDEYLLIATGHHSNSSSTEKYGWGIGNGVDVFNITNPETIQWVSSITLDGQFYGGSYDIWGVKTSGTRAYIYNNYYGAYIYDISSISAPKRVAHISMPIAKTDKRYTEYKNDSYRFPYNAENWMCAPITDVAVADGKLLCMSPVGGLYLYEDESIAGNEYITRNASFEINGSQPQIEVAGAQSFEVWDYYKDVWAVEADSSHYYVACGDDGIAVLNRDYNIVGQYSTDAPILDLRLIGNYLYVGAGTGGVYTYEVKSGKLELVSRIQLSRNLPAVSVYGVHGNNLLIVQGGANMIALLDISKPDTPVLLKNVFDGGVKYYRELCYSVGNTSELMFKGLSGVVSVDISDSGILDISTVFTKMLGEHNGFAVKDNMVYWAASGHLYYATIEEFKKDEDMSKYSYADIQVSKGGKVQVFGDYLIVNAQHLGKLQIYDISTNGVPQMLSGLEFNGLTDKCLLIETDGSHKLLVPVKKMGLAIVELQ